MYDKFGAPSNVLQSVLILRLIWQVYVDVDMYVRMYMYMIEYIWNSNLHIKTNLISIIAFSFYQLFYILI